MSVSVSKSFDEVSADLGSADNQPVERTYKIVPYSSTSWFHHIPMHAHVFVKAANKAGAADAEHHMHHPQSGEYYALTPAQLNWALHQESMAAHAEGRRYYPFQAAAEWRYVGINATPPEMGDGSKHLRERFIVVHMRSAMMMNNHWAEAKAGEHLAFVFKFVRTRASMSYVVGPSDLRVVDNEAAVVRGRRVASKGPLDMCVQVVAVRSSKRVLGTETLARVPFDPEVSKDLRGMGVHVPVGVMTSNPSAAERDEDKWGKVGVVCDDDVRASAEHAQAITLAI